MNPLYYLFILYQWFPTWVAVDSSHKNIFSHYRIACFIFSLKENKRQRGDVELISGSWKLTKVIHALS